MSIANTGDNKWTGILVDDIKRYEDKIAALGKERNRYKDALLAIIQHCDGWEITCYDAGTWDCLGCEFSVNTAKEALKQEGSDEH